MKHDLVLFDLDGTLSDPITGIARSLNYSLSHFGFATAEPTEVATHIGPPLDELFTAFTGVKDAGHLADFVAKYRERYSEIGYSENVLYPGIPEMLSQLHEAGMPLAVCTSKRIDFAERILEMFRLRSYFRFVNGADIGTTKSDQIAKLLAEGAVSPSTIMVGDRAVDLVAAHRNGLVAAGVLWGYGSRTELEREKPRHLFGNPGEISTILAGPIGNLD